MDFGLSEEQEALAGLARQILDDRCTLERLTDVEAGTERFDRELWAELAGADLLGLCLPESVGGGGFGFLEACLLLQEQGRAVAPIPLAPTLVASSVLAEFADPEVQGTWLPGVARGDRVLTVALAEVGADLRAPGVTATPADADWILSGAKTAVPFAHVADAALVSATIGDGAGVFLVPLDLSGVSLERQDTFNHEPQFRMVLDDVRLRHDDLLGPVDLEAGLGVEAVGLEGLVGERAYVLDWLVDRATVSICAVAAGVAERGMRITAEYSSERRQFERPIATFQAVGQRMADTFIDAEAIRLTMLQAATHLAAGRPADAEVAVAKYWASLGGSRVGHAGLHVHGGISIDLDYPIHRYFLWAKQLEFTLGAGAEHLSHLGTLLADEPA